MASRVQQGAVMHELRAVLQVTALAAQPQARRPSLLVLAWLPALLQQLTQCLLGHACPLAVWSHTLMFFAAQRTPVDLVAALHWAPQMHWALHLPTEMHLHSAVGVLCVRQALKARS